MLPNQSITNFSRFVYRISGMKHGVKKAIKVKVYGTECYDVSISMELGKLILDKRLPELVDVKKIYVIYEVFYAQSVSVSVTIGECVNFLIRFQCCCCCCAYLSSRHRTASGANCWTIRTLFIALTTSCLEESAPA